MKVLDYGTSKSQCGGRWITEDGLIAGTLAYMPPERLAGEVGDERVDIFALGVILMELILGRHPHARGTLSWPSESKLRKLMKQWDPETLTAIRERVPREIWNLFAKATARDPDCRFTDMADFRHSLCEALQKSASASFLLSTETPVRPIASLLRAPGSERTFAVRMLEQTPVMRPAVHIDLAADTPVVTPIRFAARHQALAKRKAVASTGVRRSAAGSKRGGLSEPVESPIIRIGTRSRIAMSLVAMVAGVSVLLRSSFVVEPVRAGQEVPAEVAMMSGIAPRAVTGVIEAAKPGRAEASKGERSPMTFARTASWPMRLRRGRCWKWSHTQRYLRRTRRLVAEQKRRQREDRM